MQAMTGAFVLLLLVVTVWFAYLLAALWQMQRQAGWPFWRLASFTCGTALLVAALSPPLMSWGHVDLRGHMAQHLALGMFAPVALMLGKPVSLLLRSVPVSLARGIATLLASSPARVLTHPFTALLLDVGALYLLYMTPLYQLSLSNPGLHLWLHLHFILAGYLFCWAIAGPDPAPHRGTFHTRLAALFLATAAHSILSKLMYGYGYPRDAGHGLAEIEVAAQLMYYGGNLAEMVLALLLFAGWYREAGRRVPAAVMNR
ncbi:Cytochrome c oxidase caa3 assembly factor (Caa3_CtaG) [Pseudomonas saudiphocaensis]|uniref:Cytochrome c oxidase caa3 assembly factor (Caa3_CtaG) n=2 Tax=Pseudomonas saudiphocaensis TaxID=1499686 RepID=A0A078LYM3_9PSED|nr:Cytochrome c oxidase caa3 assembly factor (Caa3_CtaG) [Pseudomonas saudiphocaensis]